MIRPPVDFPLDPHLDPCLSSGMAETAKNPALDHEKWKIFLREIESGLSYRGACGLAGLERRAIDRAVMNDPDLSRQIARARANLESELVDKLRDAESNCEVAKWTWLLARKFAGDYTEGGLVRDLVDANEALVEEVTSLRTALEAVTGKPDDVMG